jgi:hypothetical protein
MTRQRLHRGNCHCARCMAEFLTWLERAKIDPPPPEIIMKAENVKEIGAMSDEALAEACCPGEPEADKAAFLAALSSEHRAALERLIWVGDELNAGRVPPGVMI